MKSTKRSELPLSARSRDLIAVFGRHWSFDLAVATALAVLYVSLLVSTVSELGYARDEGFYFGPADSYANWLRLLFQSPLEAIAQPVVDRHFSHNHEHPAFMKTLFGLSHWLLHEKWRWFAEPGTAYRFPGMLMAGLALGVVYVWAARAVDRSAGLCAALLFGFLPRVFYHSHLACFDIPVASMWLVTAYAYFRSLRAKSVGWLLATGILFGLLLDTKHNSWLLPPALFMHWVLTYKLRPCRLRPRLRLGMPRAWFAMATIGPLVFFLGWPWIWFDTLDRLRSYVAFHMGHEYYNMEFLGHTYYKPPMPRGYAWLMTLATVPLTTLSAFVIGVVIWLRRGLEAGLLPGTNLLVLAMKRLGQTPRFATHVAHRARRSQRRSYDVCALWAACLFLAYAPWLSSSTPIFGGTKHWLPAYPFLCLFAGLGFSVVKAKLGEQFSSRSKRVLVGAVLVAVCSGSVVMSLSSHPFGLSAYTPVVGGASGAASLGLNRTFWGYTTGSVVSFLNRAGPGGGTVYVHDTALQSYRMLQRDGRLRSDLQGTLSIAGSDLALLHYEPHMGRVEYQIWVDYGTVTPSYIKAYDGVPVIWVYERPHR